MAEEKKAKVKVNKLTAEVILIIVLLVAIALYFCVQLYNVVHVNVETVTAVESTVYETIEAKALVIRDEQLISGETNDLTVACVNDAEKVNVNGNIAMIFSSKESATNYSKLEDLHSQLDYYVELQNRTNASVTDVTTLEKDTVSEINSYIVASNYGDIDSLSGYNEEINDKITRRQMLIGEDIDFSGVMGDLQNQINSIDANSCNPVSYITTQESGVYSSYLDGLESTFDYSNVESLDVATLSSYIETAQSNTPATEGLGKLIKSYQWYMCCVLDAENVSDLSDGDVVEVAIKDSDQVIDCTIVSGADLDLGVEQTVLVLESSEMNSSIASMRFENIEIRSASYTGFKIPSSAIHVDDEGNKCVYALVANQAVARYSDIIYSTKDFAILSYDANNSKSVRYYDQIITKGKDLHDGKDYSR